MGGCFIVSNQTPIVILILISTYTYIKTTADQNLLCTRITDGAIVVFMLVALIDIPRLYCDEVLTNSSRAWVYAGTKKTHPTACKIQFLRNLAHQARIL